MSEAKFTKGNWCVQEFTTRYGKKFFEVVTDCYDVVSNSLGIRSLSDAHLIAAAPEMYAMLEDIQKRAFHGSDLYEEIDELLAKARGEIK